MNYQLIAGFMLFLSISIIILVVASGDEPRFHGIGVCLSVFFLRTVPRHEQLLGIVDP